MRDVVIIGVGMTQFGRFPEKSCEDLGVEATVKAVKDAGIEWRQVQAMYGGHSYAGTGATNKILRRIGLTGIPVFNVELGCPVGGAVVGLAYQAIAAGFCDVACAVGFEKIPRGVLPADEFPEWERKTGLAMYPVFYGWEAQKYMRKYGLKKEHLAKVSIRSHNNAALDPYAHYQNCAGWTVDDVLNARMIVDPLTVVQIAPVSEGAAAAILCTRKVASRIGTRTPVKIAAYVQKSAIFTRPFNALVDHVPAGLRATEAAAKEAYEIAGYGPEDLDFVQCHDAYTISEILDYESLGLCGEGEAARLIDEGATELTGRIPINTDGGMMSRGNSIGGTTLASIVESVWQFRGDAGKRQLPNPRLCVGSSLGVGQNTNVYVLKK